MSGQAMKLLPDALRAALGVVISDQRREWKRERELIEAQSRELISELRARVAELELAISNRVDARLEKAAGAGVGLTSAHITQHRHLHLEMSDGRTIDAGELAIRGPV